MTLVNKSLHTGALELQFKYPFPVITYPHSKEQGSLREIILLTWYPSRVLALRNRNHNQHKHMSIYVASRISQGSANYHNRFSLHCPTPWILHLHQRLISAIPPNFSHFTSLISKMIERWMNNCNNKMPLQISFN